MCSNQATERRKLLVVEFLFFMWPQQLICVFLLDIIKESLLQVIWDGEV